MEYVFPSIILIFFRHVIISTFDNEHTNLNIGYINHIEGNIVPISQLCATFLIELMALSLNTGGAQSATLFINSSFIVLFLMLI